MAWRHLPAACADLTIRFGRASLHADIRSIAPMASVTHGNRTFDVMLPFDAFGQHCSNLRLILPAEVDGHVLDDVVAADPTAVPNLVTSPIASRSAVPCAASRRVGAS